MKIVNVKDVEAKDISKDPLFLGGKVHTQFVLEEEFKSEKIQAIMVNFAPGARNKLHTHSTEQILVVTEDKGIVATRYKEHIVGLGTVVSISPGEEHWHGATKDSPFSHLSIVGQPHEWKIVEQREVIK